MHTRYIDKIIAKLWTAAAIYDRWQQIEFAVLRARARLGQISAEAAERIIAILSAIPIDIAWLEEREKVTHHDLNAFLDERRRHLPPELRHIFHEGMTSYDTEEPARILTLLESAEHILGLVTPLLNRLRELAFEHQFTPMLGETHGQWAGIMSFGVRNLKWHITLSDARDNLIHAIQRLCYAKLSGAIGTYSDVVTPEVEELALSLLEKPLKPFHGATQIMPRTVMISLSQAVLNVVEVIATIAETYRLGARSGYPITQEPFGKGQKGSSAMPHKRNPINWEKLVGIVAKARGNQLMLQQVCTTWAERDIRESNVERDAWPDLFHCAAHALSVMYKSLNGVIINKHNMLEQILDSKGTFATDLAKGWLAEKLAEKGVSDPAEAAYRILQQASFQLFNPTPAVSSILAREVESYEGVNSQFIGYAQFRPDNVVESLMYIIPEGRIKGDDFVELNETLRSIFHDNDTVQQEWCDFFMPGRYMAKEKHLFDVFKAAV